ncbi:MAG: hypothetical protein U0V74_02375 [Chitinophagales bacterium]
MKTVIVTRIIFFFCLWFTAQTIYGVLFSTKEQLLWRLYDPMSYVFTTLFAAGATYLLSLRKPRAVEGTPPTS